MSYFNQFWRNQSDGPTDHEKAWNRASATAWDEKWQALTIEARNAYLNVLKPPAKSIATTHPSVPLDRVPSQQVEELVAADFARVEEPVGKRSGKIVATTATHDFSMRLRSLQRYQLLRETDRSLLTNYVKYAFYNQAEPVVARVLMAQKIGGYFSIDEALEYYVTSSDWPQMALKSINSKQSTAVLEALRNSNGPIRLADLPGLVKGFKPKDVHKGLSELIAHLGAFEDLKADTLEIVVGILPIVRERRIALAKADRPIQLSACEHPKETSPLGGLTINDLRVFLLEVASESPRLRMDGMIFAREEARFQAAFPSLPRWLETLLKLTNERRLTRAYELAITMGFTETDIDDKTIWLRMSDRAKKWLSSSLEDQYRTLYQSLWPDDLLDKDEVEEDDGYFDDEDFEDDEPEAFRHAWYGRTQSYGDVYGDNHFYGMSISIHKNASTQPRQYSYYSMMAQDVRQAFRESVYKAFQSLPIGVFHRWESVLAQLTSARLNPLSLGGDPANLVIFVNQRQIPRLPEPMLQAARTFLESLMLHRLIPFDAFRAAIDDEGKLCVARLPRFDGYFGRPYDPSQDETANSTKVIVQPDFSVLVIGLDPAPAVEIAPFCDRVGGHAGQGALTFKITRESVVRAVVQGLDGPSIMARLKKYSTTDIPANVGNEISEWAGWIRHVNVRPVTVLRCPDPATVARVVSVLGKNAERLSDTLVALHSHKLSSTQRQKLQDQGILITKKDIVIAPAETLAPKASTVAKSTKKRGRPPKAR